MAEDSPVQDSPAQDPPDDPEFRKWRRGVYIGAAIATGLYVLSLVPFWLIRKTGDGFEIIPVFFATIFYFFFVAPALPIALLATKLENLKLAAGLLWFSSLCLALMCFGQWSG